MNNYILRLNTDELLTISNKIENTTKEIDNTLNKMIEINNNVVTGWNDQSSKNFTDNFGSYLTEVKGIITFYNEINDNIKKYANSMETTDSDMASKVEVDVPTRSKKTKTTVKNVQVDPVFGKNILVDKQGNEVEATKYVDGTYLLNNKYYTIEELSSKGYTFSVKNKDVVTPQELELLRQAYQNSDKGGTK